jgi:ABC-2 type transport system permease protein
MPLLFTLVFGFAFGSNNSGEINEDNRIEVGVIDNDGEHLSRLLFTLLENSETLRPVMIDYEISMDQVNQSVSEDKWAGIILIPEHFSNSLHSEKDNKIIVVSKPGSVTGASIQNNLQNVINHLQKSIYAAEFSTQMATQYGILDGNNTQEEMFNEALQMAIDSWDAPPLSLVEDQSLSKENDGVNETPNAFTQSSPGMMVQFALAGLIGAAEVLVLERESGSLRRLLTTPFTRRGILAGHFCAMWMMIFSQLIILIGFAQLFLDVPYFNAPIATLLIAVSTTTFAASMGLLIGTLAKNPEQVIIFSLIPMFIFSGLGGAWMPLEFTSETFQRIGHFTPIAWAMDGFQNIIIRGLGVESALPPSLVLSGFSAFCLTLAIWRFKFE